MTQQLPLPLTLRAEATFANFFTGKNAHSISRLQALAAGQGEKFIYLWGKLGVGRSHLLQACCYQTTTQPLTAVYLPLSQAAHFSPAILDGIEHCTLLALDDIDLIAGQASWEEGLFHLYNRVLDTPARLLISGNARPGQLTLQLPDLRSRLGWGLVFQLYPLADSEKLAALQLHAQTRGLHLTEEVGQFLLNRCIRDMQELFRVLDKLDQASLVSQRKLTIPFVKEILGF